MDIVPCFRKAIRQKMKADQAYQKLRMDSGVNQATMERATKQKAEAEQRLDHVKRQELLYAEDKKKASNAIDTLLQRSHQKVEHKQRKEQDAISTALKAGALSNPQNLQKQLEIAQNKRKEADRAVKNVNKHSPKYKKLKLQQLHAATEANELKRANQAAKKLRMETATAYKTNASSNDPQQQRMIELQKQIHATRTLLEKQTKFLNRDAGTADSLPPPSYHEAVDGAGASSSSSGSRRRVTAIDDTNDDDDDDDESNDYDEYNHTLPHSRSHRSVTLGNSGVSGDSRKPAGERLISTAQRSMARVPSNQSNHLDRGSHYQPPLSINGSGSGAATKGSNGGPTGSGCFTTASELLKMVPRLGGSGSIVDTLVPSSSSASSSSSALSALSYFVSANNNNNNNNSGVTDLITDDELKCTGVDPEWDKVRLRDNFGFFLLFVSLFVCCVIRPSTILSLLCPLPFLIYPLPPL